MQSPSRKRAAPADVFAPVFKPRLAYRYEELEALVGAEPGSVKAEVAAGRLRAVKIGRSYVIPVEAALNFLDGNAA